MGGAAAVDSDAIVGEMVQRLVRGFGPEQVILFGSRAREDYDEESDVDLLVVMPEVADRRSLGLAMRRALREFGLPKDVLVLSSAEYEAERDIPGSLAYPVAHEGKVLYARA